MRVSVQTNVSPRPRPYLTHAINTCPDCGGSHWHVGRISAQCAICDAPLPLADPGVRILHS